MASPLVLFFARARDDPRMWRDEEDCEAVLWRLRYRGADAKEATNNPPPPSYLSYHRPKVQSTSTSEPKIISSPRMAALSRRTSTSLISISRQVAK